MKAMAMATAAKARDGFASAAPFSSAPAAGAEGEGDAAEDVSSELGAPGSLVVVACAMTGARTEEGKTETVSPSGSKTPLNATE